MAEQELLIGEAQAHQAEGLADLLSAVQAESDFITLSEEGSAFSKEELEKFIQIQGEKANAICLVAEVAGRLIGVLNVLGYDDYARNHVGDVFIAVHEAYRGYGVGGFLMEALLDWANHTPQISRLELDVQARNASAIYLYQKFGFAIEGTKKSAVKSKNGEFLDVYAMARLME